MDPSDNPLTCDISTREDSLEDKRERLLDIFRSMDRCIVAFSGGVDSAVAAKAAQLVLGDRAVAVTGVSNSLAEGELDQARSLAKDIGIRHLEIQTNEFALKSYTRNAADRCFHCKNQLYEQITTVFNTFFDGVIVNGANADDRHDYRPGSVAAQKHQVRSPLAECGLSKQEVRSLAKHWGLPVWDKPATPCLSSRVAYGEEVTPERLKMIDEAEQYLRNLGFTAVRVRYHRGDLARIEVAAAEIERICETNTRSAVVAFLRGLGFRFVTVDVEGFRSGSLNVLTPLDSPVHPL